MREIKFRAWTGMQMEYRVVVGALGAFYVEGIDPKDSACLSPFNTRYSDQTPVMQYTGLRDKNGKEIYEGDILSWDVGKTYKSSRPAVMFYIIEWHQNGFYARSQHEYPWHESKFWPHISSDCVVIGNIYENPELLP